MRTLTTKRYTLARTRSDDAPKAHRVAPHAVCIEGSEASGTRVFVLGKWVHEVRLGMLSLDQHSVTASWHAHLACKSVPTPHAHRLLSASAGIDQVPQRQRREGAAVYACQSAQADAHHKTHVDMRTQHSDGLYFPAVHAVQVPPLLPV